jgi:hypothetical protein
MAKSSAPRSPVSAFTIDRLKQAVLDAGLEIYRANGSEIRIAERVRMHLMDSGVAVWQSGPRVSLTIRGQRSDFPTTPADELFCKVRDSFTQSAKAHGFCEIGAVARDITDPVDQSHVLDVWHELTFSKDATDLDTLLEDVRWALRVPKCVDR